ncbi:hypothetical protein [Paraburkholderia rhizosphaerae]|uniref:hypothetical protein n=1 Tax=Paraburkholderia rhizosphaerae TaxID=480658 RepID=UPI0010648934|nr:hypothetical protein [Paraburkholderia rhizosphaerae]
MLSTHRYGRCHFGMLRIVVEAIGEDSRNSRSTCAEEAVRPDLVEAAEGKYGFFPTARQSPLLPTAQIRFHIAHTERSAAGNFYGERAFARAAFFNS